MQTISIDLPDTAFAALRKAPDEFVREMRIAAAVKWYELGELSQGRSGGSRRPDSGSVHRCLGSGQGFTAAIFRCRTGRGARLK